MDAKEKLLTDIVQEMLPYMDNAQAKRLSLVVKHTLHSYAVSETNMVQELPDTKLTERFLSAKRIEGCSEKTLKYYNSTIRAMLEEICKEVKHITTEDLRRYLAEYQDRKKSSKVTIDNIRRIISCFFAWLEDEDYIIKSPARRIHKVKSPAIIKETFTDEALEIMRDNCVDIRDLADRKSVV